MKITYALCLAVSLFSMPLHLNAALILPTATITVVKHVATGDGEFDFRVTDTKVVPDYEEDFSVITENSSGTYQIEPVVHSNSSFYLTEYATSGWQLQSINCSGPGLVGNISFPFGPETAKITVEPFANVTCIFENTQSSNRTPVLIIPGITGTEIYKGTDLLWPNIEKMGSSLSDDFLDPLGFKDDATAIDTSLTVGSIVGEPYPGHHFYDLVIKRLEEQGYTQNQNLFFFPYDWRESISKIVRNEFEQHLPLDQRTDLQSRIDRIIRDTGATKIDILAHSQGGLVVKRLLYDLPEYQVKIGKLVLVGVPHLGAPKAAKILLYGDNLGIERRILGVKFQLDSNEIKKIVHNLPAVHELLPSSSYFLHQPLGYIYDHRQFYLNTIQKTKDFLKNKGLNSNLIDKAAEFHHFDYDAFDFSMTDIETYNIAGCEQGTLGTITNRAGNNAPGLAFTAGDGTVPVVSAGGVRGAVNHYVLGGLEHAKMLSDPTVLPLVTNIVSGSNLPLANGTTLDKAQCHFNGTQLTVHSPVELDGYDEQGRHVGASMNDSSPFVELNIPGAQYEEIDHNKFMFLPAGQDYTAHFTATDNGSFSLDVATIQEGLTKTTSHYESISVSGSSKAQLAITDNNGNQELQIDQDGNGTIDAIILPSATLNQEQSEDITSPTTHAAIEGLAGESGYYRSNLSISLLAEDIQASGLLETKYRLDNEAEFKRYEMPVKVETEGAHTIHFYSVDRAGNREEEHEVSFTIDKTAPEVRFQFDQKKPDLTFSGIDNISQNPKVVDNDDLVVITDQAGNRTELFFAEKGRKYRLRADLKSLKYNENSIPISSNKFSFAWLYDKQNRLKQLTQLARSKGEFMILATYDGAKSTLLGKGPQGVVNQRLPGLVVLKISTNKGDLEWSQD